MLAVFSVAFQSIGIATALPTLMASFGAESLYPWAFTTMVSGMLAATIVAGRIADQRGPAIPMYVGFALFGLCLTLLYQRDRSLLAPLAVHVLANALSIASVLAR